jgi:tetratricopeptide (TPR) repeat protein
LIRAALEVALTRNEKLPVESLLKLASSSNDDVAKLAADHLGNSASAADVPKIQAQITRLSRPQKDQTDPKRIWSPNSAPAQPATNMIADLGVVIQKINLREQIAAAKAEERAAIIKKALSDPKLAEWAWNNFARDEDVAISTSGDSQTSIAANPASNISAFAENVLPANVTLYAAIPNPSASIDRMSAAFNAIQMDTARQQADLVLIMNAMRLQLSAQLNAEPGAPVTNYLGIDGSAPAVFARWNVEKAPAGIRSAVRRAVFLRVSDRDRFERLIGVYQKTAGDTERLADYFSGGVRFLGLLPGAFPMAARLILEDKLEKPRDFTILSVGFVGTTQWNGHAIKRIEQDRIDSAGHVAHDTAFITYVGETALLTPDLDSLRDVLTRAAAAKPTLATNPTFKNASTSSGDAFYLSNLPELFAAPGDHNDFPMVESGSLKIANAVWENLFQLKFAESDWSKPLVKFKPADLVASRGLLPANSFAYFMTNIDAARAWTAWGSALSAEQQQIFKSNWAVDFEREVLPELGPECGIAAVGVPNVLANNWDVPLVIYFQLKSRKLQDLFDKGTLFKGKPAKPNVAAIRIGTLDGQATIRNGFLVIANNDAALAALDSKEKLASSPDFSKTVKRAPEDLVAFAGLNQDAGVEIITKSVNDPDKERQLSAVLSIAKAFHSQSFYATVDATGIGARFSTLIGREGRYSVSELSSLAKDQVLTFAIIEPRGVPISNQQQLKHVRLRLRTKAAGEAERLISDISTPTQSVIRKSDNELELTVQPRRASPTTKIELPIKDPALSRYLESTRELRADDPGVVSKAHEIAGNDRDAWSVARKLGAWTFKNLTWKRVDIGDVAQTLATREADCSEFSQLYVAMARSLGLPARTVTGLAHGGSAFGGHAWVEVFIGDWIELDPTFGTDFVDATHIRDATGGLLTYAALNLVDIEVLDAPRGAVDFQLNPKSLAAKLSENLTSGDPATLTAALDLPLLTDRQMGTGSWAGMNDSEREQMTWAYRRIVLEVMTAFKSTDKSFGTVRVLRVKQNGESSEALLMHQTFQGEFLEKLTFAKAGDGWFLVEMIEADTGLKIISEMLKPAVWQITDRRNGKTGRPKAATNLVRVLGALQEAPKTAVVVADEVLKEDPDDTAVLYAKSLALTQDEKTKDAAVEIWKQLSAGEKPYAAAVLKLAESRKFSDKEEEKSQALALFEKYVGLEPDDPRGHTGLAALYDEDKKPAQAEIEYRAAVAADPTNTGAYTDLAEFLAGQKRYPDAVIMINEAAKHAAADEDVLGRLFESLMIDDRADAAENIARLLPEMLNRSSEANLNLARLRMRFNRAAQALPLLRKAAELDPKSSMPWSALAECYRQLKNWPAALSAANTALARDSEDADAYYHRACAEARLGRPKEAIASLKRSIDLDSMLADGIEDETDLKSLVSLPEFKKLLANRDKQ